MRVIVIDNLFINHRVLYSSVSDAIALCCKVCNVLAVSANIHYFSQLDNNCTHILAFLAPEKMTWMDFDKYL